MRIRTKTILVLIPALAAMLTAITAHTLRESEHAFLRVENDLIHKDVKRSVAAVEEIGTNLISKLADWATWDDCHQFINDRNQTFIDGNFADNTLVDMHVDAMLFLNNNKKLVYSASTARDTSGTAIQGLAPTPQELIDFAASNHPLLHHDPANPRSAKYGVITSATGHPIVIASRPIYQTGRQGEPNGVLVWTRSLTPAVAREISQRLGLEITFNKPHAHSDHSEIGTPTLIERPDTSTIVGHATIADVDASPVMTLHVQTSRPVYAEAQRTAAAIIRTVAISGLLCLIFTLGIISAIVTNRAARLDRALRSVTTDHKRINLPGSDEFSTIAATVNTLLDDNERAAQAALASEQRFRSLAESAPIPIWIKDQTFAITYMNAAGRALFGITDVNRPGVLQAVVHPDDMPNLVRSWTEAVKNKSRFTANSRLVNTNGSIRWVTCCGVPQFDPDDNLTAIIGTTTDITDARFAHEQISDSERKFRVMFESSPVGIALCNKDGRFIQANPQFLSLIAGQESDLPALRLHDVCADATAEVFCEVLDQSTSDVRFAPRESRLRAGEAHTVPVLISANVVADEVHGPRLWVFAEDISARIDAEERLHRFAADLVDTKSWLEEQAVELESRARELEVAKAAAEDASRAKGEFLANMSHEIRTPMTAILGYADLLLEQGLDTQDASGHLTTIRRNGEHLLGLINDILDLSKIESGKMEVESIPTDPAAIAREVIDLLNVRATSHNVTLRIDTKTALPRTFASDPVRLRQILVNLVGNAIKFTPGGTVTLALRVAHDRNSIAFDVIDNGIGMTPEQQAKLFQAFSQADTSTTRKFGGTGLGLAISRRLAQMLTGDITVTSAPNEGSTFTITIALANADSLDWSTAHQTAEPTRPAAQATMESTAGSLTGRRILLAEDGPDNQRLIAFHLRKAGAIVTIVDNGQLARDHALEAAAQGTPFDVILMDMQMPVLDGYSATSQLRHANYQGPIIALTAHAMASDRDKCLAAGCTDYLTKPINKLALIERCREQASRPAAAA